MKRLYWALFSLLLLLTQTDQTSWAINPTISRSTAELTNIGSSLIKQGVIQINGPISEQAPDSGLVKINTQQPFLSFAGTAVLETSKTINNNAGTRAGFVTQSNFFNLDSGNILVSPDEDLLIGTQEGILSISSGATIFVMESGSDTVIYDLYQAKPKQVSITVNKHKLIMQPGCMLVLTKEKTRNFEELTANCRSISYRRAQEIDLQEDNVNAFVANFSIFSALVRIQPLKQLVDSKDKRDQLLLHKLLKSAAMLRT